MITETILPLNCFMGATLFLMGGIRSGITISMELSKSANRFFVLQNFFCTQQFLIQLNVRLLLASAI